ncbi:uncharacterized protein K460DRAFT_356043 [Cucurbitaria berberidis CBS 394.84]|uniref:F-box domain-containing protein n=1 Tax=Cucurbitaria berberidis CBS 394.84 TaxID=1168544 RepID=A0A9P4GJP4_9PLEO|nr:uncharacterized protein K460DRAFT_356043 [Cucurbitaria berberidis CBS 394.84]KAF1846355.1 hypothetical protein K460DRAFT_356043 [Cucurbitaria berberidis CBS 394.84]
MEPTKVTSGPAIKCHLLLDLPDDILIVICSQCRIDELLDLRLTNSRIRNIISEYMLTIAPSVARVTFPYSDRLLKPFADRTRYTFEWLKGLIPQQLAAILVDRHRIVSTGSLSHYGIPAEDPFGDELRARVANGWHVLRSLSNISREVHRRYEVVLYTDCELDTLIQKEQIILDKRLQYMKTLPDQLANDYKLMFRLLWTCFGTDLSDTGEDEPWISDRGDALSNLGIEDLLLMRDENVGGRWMSRRGSLLLTWFVLAEGPEMFWRQWWSLPSGSSQNHIRDLARSTFRELPPTLMNRHRCFAQSFKAANPIRGLVSTSPIPYFAEYTLQRENDDSPSLVKDIMTHVPFRVNFKVQPMKPLVVEIGYQFAEFHNLWLRMVIMTLASFGSARLCPT